MRGLTPRQQQVLDFIRLSIRERGHPPTLREIGSRFGIKSTNGVNDHLKALENKGYLTRDDMKSRSLRPTGLVYEEVPLSSANAHHPLKLAPMPPPRAPTSSSDDDDPGPPADAAWPPEPPLEIKVLGRVAAGLPILADENVIDTVYATRSMLSLSKAQARDIFGLRVSGDSMIEAGIHHGDYLFVRRTSNARRGDMVVALINDEATVKYFFPAKDHVRFQPANSRMAPLLVHASELRPTTILGVVCGVFRRL
ncbi:MAG: transcriptional repressor LexA [Myxococcales bacterium]|nr:transcriptional repressor LexA [Polyangiaceae bacterium]MDW8249931.1 transcriptional repressor LexA [Myxococcales bacterium]